MLPRREPAIAWVVLTACLVCQMGLGLGGYVFAVFLKPIVTEMGWSRTAFAAAGGPLLLAMAAASPLVGLLTERLGGRAVFAGGISLVALALLGLSRMTSLWEFTLLGLLLGVGVTGLGDIPAGAVVSRWFARRRGVALGLVYTGSNIGGAIVPLVAAGVAGWASWRTALVVLAVGGWLAIFPASMLVREPAADADAGGPDPATTGMTLAEARRTSSFWILGGVLFAFYVYYIGVNQHLVAFLSDAGFTDAQAARRFSAAVAVGIAGKVLVGLLADRLDVHRAAGLTFGLMTAGSILLLCVERMPAVLPVFLAVHGFTVAAENVLLPLLVAACFGVRHLAQIYGALMVVLLPGGIAGPTVAGRVFDVTGCYWPAFALFAAMNLAATVAIVALPRRALRLA